MTPNVETSQTHSSALAERNHGISSVGLDPSPQFPRVIDPENVLGIKVLLFFNAPQLILMYRQGRKPL